jgi:hypothetical protein
MDNLKDTIFMGTLAFAGLCKHLKVPDEHAIRAGGLVFAGIIVVLDEALNPSDIATTDPKLAAHLDKFFEPVVDGTQPTQHLNS